MLIIKINKSLKVQRYLSHGIKLYVKIKDKWYCIKFDNNAVKLLFYVIDLLNRKEIK